MIKRKRLRRFLKQSEDDVVQAGGACEFVIDDGVEEITTTTTIENNRDNNTSNHHTDGVYLRYSDGHEERFDGKNKKDDVIGVTVHLGERHTCIAKFDVKDDDEGNEEFPLVEKITMVVRRKIKEAFITSHLDAYNDLDGKKHTESLMHRSCKIPLAENQYIPSQGEWLLVLMFFKKVQEALDYAHGEMLKNSCYWSSSEYSLDCAWGVSVCGGNIGFNFCCKSYTYRVRPCLK